MNRIHIYCDGGSRGNPGPGACAFVVKKDNKLIYQEGTYLGETTNNIAEYSGVLKAFEWLLKNNTRGIVVCLLLDSELVVKQLSGIYRIKEKNLIALVAKIKLLEKEIPSTITFQHVPRIKNKEADLLVNQTLDATLAAI